MDKAFANAFRRGRGVQARCLGLNLQELTLGHLFLLEEIECAFPMRMREATVADLAIGVFACSMPWREAQRAFGKWYTPFFFRLWQKRTRNQSKDVAAVIFNNYLGEALQAPETTGEGGELKAPLPFRLLTMLMADFHMKESEAMDMPVQKALILWVTEGDRRGTIKLLSERQMAFRQWVEEQERIRLEKEGKNGAA